MAKKPETEERYMIHGETSMERMGFVLAALTKVGAENIGFEIVTDVLRYKSKRAPPEVDQAPKTEAFGRDIAAEWIKENPTFKAIYLVKHFESLGRSKDGAYSVLKELVELGKIKRLAGIGNYSSSDVKLIEGPKKYERRQFKTSGEDVILGFIKGRKAFNTAQVRALFRKQHRNEVSASPLLTVMVGKRLIKHNGKGEYLVLKKAAKPKKAKPKKPTRANGHHGRDPDLAAAEEILHG